jgi:hypothetical protein
MDMSSNQQDSRVQAILANSAALSVIRYHKSDVIDPSRLAAAWAALSRDEQDFWAAAYGLDGQPAMPGPELARHFGLAPHKPDTLRKSINDRLQHWIKFGFAGLSPAIIRIIVVQGGVNSPDDLPAHINDLLFRKVGPGRFKELEAWMVANGYPSLVLALTEDNRKQLRWRT